jgi:quinol monooxygenase YgiN
MYRPQGVELQDVYRQGEPETLPLLIAAAAAHEKAAASGGVMGPNPIVVLIAFKIRPGQEGVAKQVMTALIATVRKEEPACAGITMIQDAEDPTRVLLYELWPDRDSYMGPHMETPHIKAFKAQADQLFAGPAEITFWKTVATV